MSAPSFDASALASGWSAADRAALAGLRSLGRQRILAIYDHVPRPDAAGADLRFHQMLVILAAAGHRITLLGRNGSSPQTAHAAYEALGIDVIAPDPERVVWEELDAPRVDIEALLARERFDVALLYQYFWVGIGVAEQYVPLIRRSSPTTRVLLLSDDCHWLREERRAEREGTRAELERSRGLRAKERFTYGQADLVLTITAEDAARMRADMPDLALELVHFCQDEFAQAPPGVERRSGLLFLGSGSNDANVKAVRWFVSAVLPLVRARRPHAELSIVGAPPASGWVPEGTPGVFVHGQALDLAPHLDAARVFVSPITYGTGLKTKNVAALGRGLPTVLTTISAEGMHLADDRAAFVRDEPAAFADAVVALCDDDALWQRTSHAALAHARRSFAREQTIRDVERALRRVLSQAAHAERTGVDAPALAVEGELKRQRLVGRVENRSAAHVELARRQREAGRLEEAKQSIRNVFCELCCLPLDAPVYCQLHALLAVIYLAAGEFDEAALAAREALRLQPDLSGEARDTLERVLAACSARAAEARQSSAARASADVDRAKRAFQDGDLESACELVIGALQADERSADAWNTLGVLLHVAGDHAESLAAFDRALALDPANADAASNRADVVAVHEAAALLPVAIAQS